MALLAGAAFAASHLPAAFFEIQIVDEETGRGVPLMEAETVHRVRFVTDSAGRIALAEPDLMGREVFFSIQGPGYEYPKDGFGIAGVRLTPKAGERAVVKVKRVQPAERMVRLTGAGIYRDSVLLGYPVPLAAPLINAGVVGQDSAQAAVWRDRVWWIWGDTSRLNYPLGIFRSTGATSLLPAQGGLRPEQGIDFTYFAGKDGLARAMVASDAKEGMIWLDGLAAVPDAAGQEQLVVHYSRMKSLTEVLEHGLAVFDATADVFRPRVTLPPGDKWRHLAGHPSRAEMEGKPYLAFGPNAPNVRVPFALDAVLDPSRYEALQRGPDGKPVWSRQGPPLSAEAEEAQVKAGTLKMGDAWLLPVDAATGKRVKLHNGSVRWNPWRKRWILIAGQQGGQASFLGEVWYAESAEIAGPWRTVHHVATHPKMDFYNPVHREFFDEQGGRVIYFEGTYTNTFSGNPAQTPRYDYNQVLYRIDLRDRRLGLP